MLDDHGHTGEERAPTVGTALVIQRQNLPPQPGCDPGTPGHALRLGREGMPPPFQQRECVRAARDVLIRCGAQGR